MNRKEEDGIEIEFEIETNYQKMQDVTNPLHVDRNSSVFYQSWGSPLPPFSKNVKVWSRRGGGTLDSDMIKIL